MACFRDRGQEALQFAKAMLGHTPAVRRIEYQSGGFSDRWRTIAAGSKMHRSHPVVTQVDLRVRRLPTAGKGRFRAAFLLQAPQREFNVFTGAQFVGGKVRTGTKVLSRLETAYHHAITGFRLRVAYPEIREKRFGPDVLQREVLITAKLAA